MSSTLFERTRALHEEVERYERLVAKDFHAEAKTHASRLSQSHRVKQFVDGIRKRSAELAGIYADEDGSRKEEVAAMAGENVFSIFYERLKDVKDYHRRHPGLETVDVDAREAAYLSAAPRVDFSGEEGYGRYLDLHAFHQRFLNAKFGKKDVTYLDFLDLFARFDEAPRATKLSGGAFRAYLGDLLEYLSGFYAKAQPLSCLSDPLAPAVETFASKWSAGEVEGWEDRGAVGGSASSAEAGAGAGAIDLDDFETSGDLEALGADRLKEALVALGLKAGGSVSQKAERLMKTKGKKLEDLDRKLFAKGKAPARSEAEAAERQAACEAVALLECKVAAMAGLLAPTVQATRAQVEKKATSTYEEFAADMQDQREDELRQAAGAADGAGAGAMAGEDEEEEDDDKDIIYNPLKLPVGWDGKPIPYWLYKLHGLNQEFKCEICGDFSYFGRRAFEKHFKEARHQHGMRCLGIPNNKVFAEITKIDDALKLWKTLQEKEQQQDFDNEEDEEFEDKDGNVYNKKTYMDLQRQGLL